MALTPELWKKVKKVVAEALEFPPEKREQFVRSECGGDLALLEEAVSLLRCATAANGSAQNLIKGRYRIASELAQGGFAVTYLAFDEGLHSRRVVVKMLSNRQAEPYIQQKFEEEIRALSLLEHPNIITPLDCGSLDDGALFLVMQFAEGKTLRQMIKEGPLDSKMVSVVVRRLGAALGFAHARGIIHRDLKPENVIAQTFPDGTVHVKLIDFGISTVGASDDLCATRIVGTFAYMAPEQFQGQVSSKTDIFGLGALVYELLTGTPPFGRRDPPKILNKQSFGSVAPFAKDLRINPRTESLIARALAYDPNKRPSNVGRFAEELADSLLQTADARHSVLKMRWPIAVAISVLICAIIVTFMVSKSRLPTPPEGSNQAAALPGDTGTRSQLEAELIRFDVERAGDPGDVEPGREGVLTMKQRDRFRLHVQPSSQGHLYVFARSLETSDLHVLFPSRTANEGLSLLTPPTPVAVPSSSWFSFGSDPGTETLVLIWSIAPEPLLDQAEQFANPTDKSDVPDGPIARRVNEMMSMPNSLRQVNLQFQLVGKERACGRLTLSHR